MEQHEVQPATSLLWPQPTVLPLFICPGKTGKENSGIAPLALLPLLNCMKTFAP